MWGSSFSGVGVPCHLGISPPSPHRGMGEMEVSESREAKVTGGSEIEVARDGPCRERSTLWAWKLPEASS